MLWALVCMTGVSGCQTGDMHGSLPDSPTEAVLLLPLLLIGGMAWAIESTGVHLQPSVTIEPKERVLSARAYALSGVRLLCQRFDRLGLYRSRCF
jgi:hypothetical protein